VKWRWAVVVVILLASGILAFLFFLPPATGNLSARIIQQTIDDGERQHIRYAVSNGTSQPLELSLASLQAHQERTGWWQLDTKQTWQIEKNAGQLHGGFTATLNPKCAAELEIVPQGFRLSTPAPKVPKVWAVRGTLQFARNDRSHLETTLKKLGRRLGLSRRWVMPGAVGWISLPDANFDFSPVPLPSSELVTAAAPARPLTVAQPAEVQFPAGFLKLQSTDMQTVLNIYADLAEAQLDIQPAVRISPARISLEITQAVSRLEAVALLEQALHEQAGVLVKHLENKHIAVGIDQKSKKTE